MDSTTELRLTNSYALNEKIKKEIGIHNSQQEELKERLASLVNMNRFIKEQCSALTDVRKRIANPKTSTVRSKSNISVSLEV
jgi:hypothetical protein